MTYNRPSKAPSSKYENVALSIVGSTSHMAHLAGGAGSDGATPFVRSPFVCMSRRRDGAGPRNHTWHLGIRGGASEGVAVPGEPGEPELLFRFSFSKRSAQCIRNGKYTNRTLWTQDSHIYKHKRTIN
jgi:hypothetical protein